MGFLLLNVKKSRFATRPKPSYLTEHPTIQKKLRSLYEMKIHIPQHPSISCLIGPDSETTRGTLLELCPKVELGASAELRLITFVWLAGAGGVLPPPVTVPP